MLGESMRWQALHMAMALGRVEMVQMLVEAGAKVDAPIVDSESVRVRLTRGRVSLSWFCHYCVSL
jgi:hypothetical protein